MTAEDIIAANPGKNFVAREIAGRSAVTGIDPDGVECWAFFQGEIHVFGRGPLTDDRIEIALRNLDGAQPGKEFKTVAADAYAQAVRSTGLTVIADPDGNPRTLFKGESA